jgi:hypothetical protein
MDSLNWFCELCDEQMDAYESPGSLPDHYTHARASA